MQAPQKELEPQHHTCRQDSQKNMMQVYKSSRSQSNYEPQHRRTAEEVQEEFADLLELGIPGPGHSPCLPASEDHTDMV